MTMGMALGDGLLQEVWFSDSSKEEGSPRKSYVDKAEAAEDRKWRVGRNISEPSSAVVCALSQLIYIFILKWNMNITFSNIL